MLIYKDKKSQFLQVFSSILIEQKFVTFLSHSVLSLGNNNVSNKIGGPDPSQGATNRASDFNLAGCQPCHFGARILLPSLLLSVFFF